MRHGVWTPRKRPSRRLPSPVIEPQSPGIRARAIVFALAAAEGEGKIVAYKRFPCLRARWPGDGRKGGTWSQIHSVPLNLGACGSIPPVLIDAWANSLLALNHGKFRPDKCLQPGRSRPLREGLHGVAPPHRLRLEEPVSR